MKRILVIAKNRQTPTIDFFLKIIGELGLEASVTDKPRRGAGDDRGHDLVINRNFGMDYRDADLDLMEELELNCLNPVHAQRICRDKMLCHRWLCQNSLPAPETWMLKDFPRERAEKAQGPKKWTLKTQRGMQGRGVDFFDNGDDLLFRLERLKDERHIVQDHISFSRELRSVHIGGRVLWFEKDGGNLYQGGQAKPAKEVSSQVQSLAAQIQSSLGLNFAAVDFLQEGQKYWVVDVNCYPGVGLLNQIEGSVEMVKDMLLELVSKSRVRMKQ